MSDQTRQMDIGEAALKGAVASLIGGVVMKLLWQAEQTTLVPEERRVTSPSTTLIENLAEKRGLQISETQAAAAGAAFYGGNMAVFGAIYGIVQSRLHPPSVLHGLVLGGLVYAANYPSFGVLPKAGIVPPPQEQSLTEALIPVAPHIAFGLTTAAVFEALS